ncbi:lipoprotein-anchoring transpeptidase ErfK/SrfK [Thermocatellispora tengchongensis]|uniref:Lipoprotein-anchoring transpeptidase ErfK/SrfK n=1 Tax=Thermocatellispora tengchongensis TaxID=1073253 RepID=A0A840NSJ0_9ACTN|nr:L,D-transpeptidase family protein [Thermocatellispora tengchongensis]MBB5131644.1 lipoprotein-anchoring transpeptidase ErfK/SrfK [Thermocatellispora tengchongensis]
MGIKRRLGTAAIAAAGALLLSAPGAALPAQAAAPARPATAATAQQAEPAPFTAPGKKLKLGAKGAAVKQLQARLKELGYPPGRIDGRYGGATLSAVWAFQKVNGITPTSTVAARTWRALEDPKAPKVLVPKGRPTRVEINLTRQIMVLYVKGEAKLISHTSSGSNVPYCETAVWQGKKQRFCGSARTPTGDYKTTWRVSGWHRSYLGQLYNPIFFNGGIALHGALSVPLAPASHGCVRLPMHVAEILPGMLGKGVPVHVRGAFRR